MKKLLIFLTLLFISWLGCAQPVDFSKYERVIQRGDVSIVRQNDEYRLIVGSLKHPKICLFLGMSADYATRQMNRILNMGADENYQKFDRLISFCGECFIFSVKGAIANHTYSFIVMNSKSGFSLDSDDIHDINRAILQ